MKLTGRVDGLAQLTARLSAIADETAFAPELQATAEDIRGEAAANLGEGSALAQSLAVTPDSRGGYIVSTPLDDGWHREFGGLTRAPKPWLAPAAETARPRLIERLAGRLNAILRRAAPRG